MTRYAWWRSALRSTRFLEFLSCVYLFLPALLFCIGYLKWWIALVIVASLLVGLYRILRSSETGNSPRDEDRTVPTEVPVGSRWSYLLILALVIYLALLSGMAGFFYQNPDYGKHNAFLRDFVEYEWPIAYEQTGPNDEPGIAAYYIYYYLPAAITGKVLGWNAANLFTLAWGILGAWIAVMWFLRLVGRVSFPYALLFFFFGGLDLIGWTIVQGWYTVGTINLDSWLAIFARQTPELTGMWMAYGSTLALFYWAPHQALAAWIATGFIMYSVVKRDRLYGVFLVWSSLILWSTFAALGMLPFLIVMMIRFLTRDGFTPRSLWAGFRKLFTFPDAVAGSLLLFVQVMFLFTNNSKYPSGFLWKFQDLYDAWPTLLLFYIVEFGMFLIVCPPVGENVAKNVKPWIWTALAALIVIPFYRLGLANDFVSRVSIPALFVLAVYLATAIERSRSEGNLQSVRVLLCLLVIGAAPAVAQLANAHKIGFNGANHLDRSAVQHINELEPKKIADHYFGDPESFFVQYLAAPIPYQAE